SPRAEYSSWCSYPRRRPTAPVRLTAADSHKYRGERCRLHREGADRAQSPGSGIVQLSVRPPVPCRVRPLPDRVCLPGGLARIYRLRPNRSALSDFLPFAAFSAVIADAVAMNFILGNGLVGAVFQDEAAGLGGRGNLGETDADRHEGRCREK